MNEHNSQESLTRKEREKRARQQDILKAARELFTAKGFRDTTLDEIAQKAEFGKGTLYNYFSSKDEIFHAIIDQAIEDSITMARECAAEPGDARSRFTSYARKTMQFIRENGELLHVIFQELHGARKMEHTRLKDILDRSRTVTGTMGAVLRHDMDKGLLVQGDPARYVSLLDDMVRGFASKQVILQGGLSDEEIDHAADLIVSLLFDGITVRNSKG
jgi:TetR/AcrR family transcriptional regulator, repressor of fatR-cypB operon